MNQFDPYSNTNYGGSGGGGGMGYTPSAPAGPSPNNNYNGRPTLQQQQQGVVGGAYGRSPQQLPPLQVPSNMGGMSGGGGGGGGYQQQQYGGGGGIMTSSPQFQSNTNNNNNNNNGGGGTQQQLQQGVYSPTTPSNNMPNQLPSPPNQQQQQQQMNPQQQPQQQFDAQQQQQQQQISRNPSFFQNNNNPSQGQQQQTTSSTNPSLAQQQQQQYVGGVAPNINRIGGGAYGTNNNNNNNNNIPYGGMQQVNPITSPMMGGGGGAGGGGGQQVTGDYISFIRSVDTSKWRLTDLDLKETLGTGTFGRVRLCKHKMYNKFFALKMIKKQEIIRMKQVDHILSEAAILQEIRHPFIVNMVKGFADEDRLYLLMELVVGGEMFSHLRKAGKFPNDVAKFYCCEVLLAFEYLHERLIIYRDLKPENILLDEGGHVKLADFGFAKKVTERTFTLCGTPEYIAPEVIQSRGHGKAVDYWALGILLYEMIVGYPPFFDESPFKTYEKILEGKLQFPKWVDARARDIIRGLLTADHTKRLGTLKRGMQDLKKHKYFAGVDWEVMLMKKIPAPIPVRVAKDGDSRYFDRYPESPPNRQLKALTQQQQDLFKGFCNGEYGTL